MNPRAVGKTPQQLAALAGIDVPAHARILVAELDRVGREEPLSAEKLTTVLGWYVEKGWRAGCERSIELLRYGGDGHSLVIHATDEDVILAFGIEKPAFRIVVNSWGTLGAIGATTGVMPAMTLAPGGIGGAVVSDNITVTHLLNVKRLAYPLQDPPAGAYEHAPDVRGRPARRMVGPARARRPVRRPRDRPPARATTGWTGSSAGCSRSWGVVDEMPHHGPPATGRGPDPPAHDNRSIPATASQ